MMATHEMLKKVVQEELGPYFFGGEEKMVAVGCFGRQGRGIYKNLVLYRYSVRFQQITGDI